MAAGYMLDFNSKPKKTEGDSKPTSTFALTFCLNINDLFRRKKDL